MSATYKSIQLLQDLKSEGKQRLSTLTFTDSFSSDGSPMLSIGTGVAGTDGAFLKLTPITSLFKNIVGNTQDVFCPHIAQLVFEADFAGTTDNVANSVTAKTKLNLVAMLAARGLRIEWYESAYGTFPVEASITSGNLKATFDLHPQYGLQAGM